MGVWKKITKQLFGDIQPDEEGNIVVDGRIVPAAESGEILPDTEKSRNTVGGVHPERKSRGAPLNSVHSSVAEDPGPTAVSESETEEPPFEQPVTETGPWSLPEEYLVYLRSSNKSPRTIKEYCYDLNTWNRQYPLNTITRNQIEKAMSKLHPSTARRKIAALRSLAKWRLRDGNSRLHAVLAQIVPPRIPGRVPKDRGAEDFRNLVVFAQELCERPDHRGLWLGLMLCCGLRISEIQTVELSGNGTIKVRGKGDKERLIPAPAWLRDSMRQQSRKQWRKKHRRTVWKGMKDIGVKHPHSLRHTYASELIRKGVPLEEIQKLLGHSKLDTTLVYAKIKVPENITERLGIE
jgi:site-specific recombinase XerD